MDRLGRVAMFGVSNTEHSPMCGTGHACGDRLPAPGSWSRKGVLWYLRFGELGWSRKRAAAFLGLTERSLRRFENGHETPRSVYVTALRMATGDLGLIHPAWSGFRLAPDGRLWHDELKMAEGFTAGEIVAHSYRLQYLAALERKCRELEAQLSGLQNAANQEEFGFDQEAANE